MLSQSTEKLSLFLSDQQLFRHNKARCLFLIACSVLEQWQSSRTYCMLLNSNMKLELV